jgi:hypothetical protein
MQSSKRFTCGWNGRKAPRRSARNGDRAPDHREREWRHLDTCQFQTRLHACAAGFVREHGVVQIRVPWPAAKEKIVFDKFHVAEHLNDAVDRVRRAGAPRASRTGRRALVGTKYARLRSPESFATDAWKVFGPLRRSNLKVARAWTLKETIMDLWNYSYVGTARNNVRRWCSGTHDRERRADICSHAALG